MEDKFNSISENFKVYEIASPSVCNDNTHSIIVREYRHPKQSNFKLFFILVISFISVSCLFADEAFEKLIQYYNSKQYKNVITESEKVILNSDEQKSELRFLIGISWLYLNDFKQAITNLSASLELNKKNYLANFYLGIAYLKIKNYEKAVNEFDIFIQNSQDKNLIETAKKHLERIKAEQDNINLK